MNSCELCESAGGEIVWQDERCRVVRVGGTEGADYPGFCRVVWQAHVREMSDLPAAERRHLMAVVFAAEKALRALFRPDKINLASLGNLVPHLHWHVIPRFADDRNFPAPIWAEARRKASPANPALPRPTISKHALHEAIAQALAEEKGGSIT